MVSHCRILLVVLLDNFTRHLRVINAIHRQIHVERCDLLMHSSLGYYLFQKILFFINIFTYQFSYFQLRVKNGESSLRPSHQLSCSDGVLFSKVYPSLFLSFKELTLWEFSSYCQFGEFAAGPPSREKHLLSGVFQCHLQQCLTQNFCLHSIF